MLWDLIKLIVLVVLIVFFTGVRDAFNERDQKYAPPPAERKVQKA